MNNNGFWAFAKEHPIITFLLVDTVAGIIPKTVRAIKGTDVTRTVTRTITQSDDSEESSEE